MKRPPCHGCRGVREKVAGIWPSCKEVLGGNDRSQRLCDRVDISLIVRYPGKPISFYDGLWSQIGQGQLRLASQISAGKPLPQRPEALCDLVLAMHRELFHEAEPNIAGRFRILGEDAFFGGEGRNQMEGARTEEIGKLILGAFCLLRVEQLPNLSSRELAFRLAIFLEEFFRIHPFVDGNGRIGRSFIELVVTQESRFKMKPLSNKRKYMKALEYAHRHAPNSHDVEKQPGHKNPWVLLTNYIEEHLEEPNEFLGEISPTGER